MGGMFRFRARVRVGVRVRVRVCSLIGGSHVRYPKTRREPTLNT